MNKKGQALVEFIMILPVFLIILMAIIDIGNIYVKKNELNSDLEVISEMYENGKRPELMAYVANENLEYEENVNGDLVNIEIKKNINVNAPILSNIIGSKYEIKVSKIVYGVSS